LVGGGNSVPQGLATFSELPTAKKPKPASHQPAGRASPAPGDNEQNHRLTNSILRLAVAQLAASISDLITRVKRTGCPFERKYFECHRLISRLVGSLEILAEKTPDFLGLAATVRFIGGRLRFQHMDVGRSVSIGYVHRRAVSISTEATKIRYASS
jgi:hypothetical protein